MSRLQTKCVVGSAVAHGLLLGLLVVGSAFVKPPPKPESIRFVKIFRDSQITDAETQGGGNPNVPSDATPPTPTPALPIQPPVAPPQEPPVKETPKVKVVEPPKQKPQPQKHVEVPKVSKNPSATKIVPKKDLTPEVKPDKPKIEVNLDVKKATADPDAQRKKIERDRAAKEERDRQQREYQAAIRAQMDAVDRANKELRDRQAAFSGAVGKLDNALTRTTNVEMPGPGGEAFINYADLLYTRYYQAWQTPDGRDVRTPVKVEIVVARDGRVISSSIIRASGDAQLDRSVRQALDRVTKLQPFPEGAKDLQRTFRINFELKSKRQFG